MKPVEGVQQHAGRWPGWARRRRAILTATSRSGRIFAYRRGRRRCCAGCALRALAADRSGTRSPARAILRPFVIIRDDRARAHARALRGGRAARQPGRQRLRRGARTGPLARADQRPRRRHPVTGSLSQRFLLSPFSISPPGVAYAYLPDYRRNRGCLQRGAQRSLHRAKWNAGGAPSKRAGRRAHAPFIRARAVRRCSCTPGPRGGRAASRAWAQTRVRSRRSKPRAPPAKRAWAQGIAITSPGHSSRAGGRAATRRLR